MTASEELPAKILRADIKMGLPVVRHKRSQTLLLFKTIRSQELEYLKKERSNILEIDFREIRDLFQDREITSQQDYCELDPLAIGGQENSLRNSINCLGSRHKVLREFSLRQWTHTSGAFYKIEDGRIVPVPFDTPQEVQDSLETSSSVFQT